MSTAPKHNPISVREVWSYNLEAEFNLIKGLIDYYPFVSMDTEFPGVIFKPSATTHHRKLRPSDHYSLLKSNVDALNIIQLGLTLSNGASEFVWEFNFSDFDLSHDPHALDSIELLRKHGINFDKNRAHGINSVKFAELIMTSGLLFSDSVSWITFHSAYDFAYLVKILTRRPLPYRLEDFLGIVKLFFGNNVYDVKHLMRFCNSLYGGLDRVAGLLEVGRAVGKCHQAGSDSLLTWHAFQRIRELYFVQYGPEKHAGVLYGLEVY